MCAGLASTPLHPRGLGGHSDIPNCPEDTPPCECPGVETAGCSGHCSSCQLVQLKQAGHVPGGGRGLFAGLLRKGVSSHTGEERKSGGVRPTWQTQQVRTQPLLPMKQGQVQGVELGPTTRFPSVPQMSCALTTPIAFILLPRRSASQWRCCSG